MMAKQLEMFTAGYSKEELQQMRDYILNGSRSTAELDPSSSALMERVISNLTPAMEKVASNKGSHGPDKRTISDVKADWLRICLELTRQLRKGTYRPGLTRRVWIPKSSGGQRALGIPNVIDRVVQTAVCMVLEPRCEMRFHPNSHGFRHGRSCHTAIRQAQAMVANGKNWVVDIDLEKFFDTVHHQRLMARLESIVQDKSIMILIGRMLKAKTLMPDGIVTPNELGVPQGGPLSALLSNVVLDELDWELDKRGHAFVRYADDLKIYVKSKRAGQRVMRSVSRYIEKKLRLKVNQAKSAVAHPRDRHFVGFRLEGNEDNSEVDIRLSKRSVDRIKRRIVELTPRNWGSRFERCIEKINSYLKGWLGFSYVVAESEARTLHNLDAHIRRRLRAVKLKQWKRKRTRAKELMRLGISKRAAHNSVYNGRKSIWALSKSYAANKGMNNQWFKDQGLFSLEAGWQAKHPQTDIKVPQQYLLFGRT